MNRESMDSSDCSSCAPAASSVCHVCQGFGDLRNSRGFTEELKSDELIHNYLVDETYEFIYVYVHHPNVGVLLASAEAGCDVYTVLYDSLRRYRDNDLNIDTAVALYSAAQESQQPELVTHTTSTDDDTKTAIEFAQVMRQDRAFREMDLERYENGRVVLSLPCDNEWGPRACSNNHSRLSVQALTTPLLSGIFVFFVSSPHDILDPELEHRPARDLLSGPHIDLVNRWRDTCKTDHLSCNRSGYKQQLPSRVLELSDPGIHESLCAVRLVETHEKMRGAYACLSYCWGDPEIQNLKGQTTNFNLSRQLQLIDLESLPETIIDTIYLCFKLGFRFLWVDRLCIIQDDDEDWEREASKMCDIYSRSALTISVPLCIESSQSFLKKRLNTSRFEMEDKFATIDYIDENSRKKGRMYLIISPLSRNKPSWFLEHTWEDFVSTAGNAGNRWLSRGWTFQEWMLSPRVLHIDTMTLWDCFDGYANEFNRRYTERPRLLRDPQRFGGGISWDPILSEYTARHITYKKDRLPALAGLAARYSQATGHRYLYGLWFEEMPRSLLWYRPRRASQEISEDDERAESNHSMPSWSWASTGFGVRYEDEFLERARDSLSFLSEASVYRCSANPNSVSSKETAWIDIEGYICVVTDQDMLGHYWGMSKHRLKGGNDWWNSIPDRVLNYPGEDIAQSRIHLVILGSSDPDWSQYGGSSNVKRSNVDSSDGRSSDGESSDGESSDSESSGHANSGGGSSGDANSDNAYSDDGNIDRTRSGGSSDKSELEDAGRVYGALVLERCGSIDDRECFRRLRIAYSYWNSQLKVHDGPSWELRDVRLI